MRRSPFRFVSLAALAGLISMAPAVPAAAATSTLDLLLDLDNDAATGCTVSTPDGPFAGVEQVLTTTIDTVGAASADVVGVERAECIDPGTNTFGAPIAVGPGGWPVGVGLGVDGFNVVETYFPLAATPLDPSVVRFGVLHTRGIEVDALLVAAPGTDTPILLDLRSILEIPTLGEWGLLLLALLLAVSSLALLGRRGRVALLLVFVMGTAGVAWAQCVLDGLPDDWGLGDLLGEDPAVADDGVSIRAVFGRAGGGQLCFRADVSLQFNQPPTITPIADQTIPEDSTTGALAFTVDDLETAAAALVVTAISSNQILVPDANMTLGGAGANRTITVTPAANQNGMTTVTLTVEDGAGVTASTSFLVTVTSLNDPPTITPIADQVILEDSTTGPLAFTVGDTETAAAALVVSASSSNTAIIPNANLVLGGAGANRTITVTPAADQNGGPVTITVTVQDGDGGSVPEQLLVTVTPVNDAPSFTLAGNVSSDEDAGAQVVIGQATAISPGPANEAGQTVSFLVSNDNNALFGTQPAIDAAGTLTYEAAADANGVATVTVQAMDDGGTANGGVDTSAAQMFTITVNPVNDPPTLATNVINYQAVGNTLLRVDGLTDGVSGGAGHDVPLPGRIASTTDTTDAVMAVGPSDPDTPAASLGFVPGVFPTMLGGLVTIDDDGDFFYVPPVGVEGMDTVMLTFTDGTTNLPVTLNITVAGMVWYVEDTVDGSKNLAGGPGTSVDAFETLAAAEAASGPNHYILVFETDAPLDETITLKAGQKLYGQPIEDLAPALLPGGLLLEEIADTDARPVIDRSTGDAVRVVANAGNGDRSGVEIRHLQIEGEDNAIDVSAADANNLDVALSGNVLSSITGASLLVNGAGSTGTTVVRELTGTSVSTSGAGGGQVFESVTFDADVVTAGIQPVAAGNVNVGNPGAPGDVVGHGVRLNSVRGILDFGTLNVGNTGGVGLFVRDADGKAGTFVLDTDGGAINTVNGPAVDLDPVGLGLGGGDGMVLSSVTANVTAGVVPHGINLHTVAGSFQVTGATSISATGGGMLTTGITATDAVAGITFTGPTTVSNTQGAGIALTNVDGPLTVASLMSNITGAGGAAIDVDQGLGNVTYNGSINNTAGRSVEITNHEGPGGGSTIALTGAITDSGTGIFLDNNDQGAGGTVINLTGALNLTTGASNAFTATNGGMVNVTDPANNNLAATTTGTGVTIANTTIGGSGVKFTTVNVGDANLAAPNAASGILLTNAGAGAFTATGGAIQNVTSRGLDVSGGTGNVTVGTSVGTTSTGRSLEVTGHTGGTVAMSGAIDDNGLGVNLDSNMGGTVNVTGSMDIDTVGANIGFNATGGGTVNVMTGVNDVNTSAGSGIAVNIVNTTVGTSGVTFRSVSANGAPNGIVLNGTGTTGPFQVTGAGGACDPGDTTCSGGTIQNITNDGVRLENASDVTLNRVRLLNANLTDGGGGGVCDGNTNAGCRAAVNMSSVTAVTLDTIFVDNTEEHGINGSTVRGLRLLNSTVRDAGNAINEHGLHVRELLGTATGGDSNLIQNTLIRASNNHNAFIVNSTATNAAPGEPDLLEVIGSTFRDLPSPNGANGLLHESRSAGNMRLEVSGSTFLDNRGIGINLQAAQGGRNQISVTGSTFDSTNTASGAPLPFQDVGVSIGATQTSAVTFDVSSNPLFTTRNSHHVNLVAFDTASLTGTIANNPNMNGSQNGSGVAAVFEGGSTGTVLIENNVIGGMVFGRGLDLQTRAGAGSLDVTVRGNNINGTIPPGGAFGLHNVFAASGNGTMGESNRLCIHYDNNTAPNPNGFTNAYLVEQWAGTSFQIQDLAPGDGSATSAQIVTHIESQNASGNAEVSPAGFGVVVSYTANTCATP